jgi:hypothetical protein
MTLYFDSGLRRIIKGKEVTNGKGNMQNGVTGRPVVK